MNISYPKIKHPDQDLVSLYNTVWELCEKEWFEHKKTIGGNSIFVHPEDTTVNQFTTIMSTFFLVYCDISTEQQLDFFYDRQEEDGAIRSDYDLVSGKPVKAYGNPLGMGAPLFPWAEYALYHKLDSKKRIQTVVKVLEKYWDWIDRVCLKENGLYALPLAATGMRNSPRDKLAYPIDFNLQQAISANYMAKLGSIINDKEISFRYRKKYLGLRTQINNLMWDAKDRFYFDLDGNQNPVRVKSIAAFWALLAQLPNEDKLEGLMTHLNSPDEFALQNLFPTLAKDEQKYSPNGEGYRGSVFPPYTYMIIKGLENYSAFRSSKKYALQHIHAITETIKQHRAANEQTDKEGGGEKGWGLAEAYRPEEYKYASWSGKKQFPRKRYTPYLGLSAIALLVENVIGLQFSVPKKTVELTLTHMEHIGIMNILLKKNSISIICDKTHRGWEIHLSSEKLYYFTVHMLNIKKRTLPIPSGKCSLLIGKLLATEK